MDFEFQHHMESGHWANLGVGRTPADIFEVALAFRALRTRLGGVAPKGAYRFRILGADERWRYGEADGEGHFQVTER